MPSKKRTARLEVSYEGVMALSDITEKDEAAAMRWCDRWAEILIREVTKTGEQR